jgi:2-phosphosulfolactate phosphatase
LVFTADEIGRKDLENKTVVVIDALRATSTMITALENGCLGFIPVATIEEAKKLFDDQADPKLLLGGERRALPVAGFHLGNSPHDYIPEKVRGKIVIMTTTNGTRALVAASKGAEVLIGAFLNLGAVCRRLEESGRDVLIACSGEKDCFCLEDTVCGGAMIERLEKNGASVKKSDAALGAKTLYESFAADICGMLATCEWGQYLEGMGLGKDVRLCAQIDSSQLVPVYRKGKVYIDR